MTAVPGSGGWIPSDGWIADPYFKGGKEFRRFARKYLITGLPFLLMPWAAQMDMDKTLTEAQWKANNDQLDVAVEFNLPVAFFWVYGTSCHFGGYRAEPKTEIDKINHWVWNYIERARALPDDYAGLPTADFGEGDSLEVGPDTEGRYVYVDDFSTSKCVDEATMSGFRDFVLDGRRLSARGFGGRPTDAALVYHFRGDFDVNHPTVQVTATVSRELNGKVTAALSTDGKEWLPGSSSGEAADGNVVVTCRGDGDARFVGLREFWVKIRFTGEAGSKERPPVQADEVRIEAGVDPPQDFRVAMKPSSDDLRSLSYEDDFRTQKYLFTTIRENDETLAWQDGSLSVQLRPGGSRPEIVWNIVSEAPLRDIGIQLDGRGNRPHLGSSYSVDVSLDGKDWLHPVSSADQETDANGWASKGLSIDLSADARFRGIREFFVRARLFAQSHPEVHPARSAILERLRVEGVAD